MSTRREEIALELEWLDVEERFLAAKTNRAQDPDEYREAKTAMSEMRTYWREIRQFFRTVENEEEG
jgi:hypothetical protein